MTFSLRHPVSGGEAQQETVKERECDITAVTDPGVEISSVECGLQHIRHVEFMRYKQQIKVHDAGLQVSGGLSSETHAAK